MRGFAPDSGLPGRGGADRGLSSYGDLGKAAYLPSISMLLSLRFKTLPMALMGS
jgi:hypothetical protein